MSAAGSRSRFGSVAEILAKSLGKDIEPVITQKYRAGDIRHCYADITKARTLLGYEPQVTHEEGFRELAEWLARAGSRGQGRDHAAGAERVWFDGLDASDAAPSKVSPRRIGNEGEEAMNGQSRSYRIDHRRRGFHRFQSGASACCASPEYMCAVFDNLSRRRRVAQPRWLRSLPGADRLEVIQGDVRDAQAVQMQLADATEIYHLAAQVAVTTSVDDPANDFEVNAHGNIQCSRSSARIRARSLSSCLPRPTRCMARLKACRSK